MKSFLTGFLKGAAHTPIGFFAPALILWRALVYGSEELITKKTSWLNPS